MADSQIVTNIIENIDNCVPSVGDRYIIKSKNKCEIVEYNEGWVNVPLEQTPKYIFVSDKLITVILFNNKIWTTRKWFICTTCNKLTTNKMKCTLDVNEICIHCFYKMNHNNPNRDEYDGKPMTIGMYIKKYAYAHNTNTCSDSSNCFLCDFKNNKLLLDINDRDVIYKGKLIDILKDKTLDIKI